MSSVAKYLKNKGTYVPRTLTVSPLVHKVIIDKLQAFETLSLFHLKSHPSQLPIIRAHWNDLDDAVALFLPPLVRSSLGSSWSRSGGSASRGDRCGRGPCAHSLQLWWRSNST